MWLTTELCIYGHNPNRPAKAKKIEEMPPVVNCKKNKVCSLNTVRVVLAVRNVFLKWEKWKQHFIETTIQRLYNVLFTMSNKTAPNYQTYEETENVTYTPEKRQSMKTDLGWPRCWN